MMAPMQPGEPPPPTTTGRDAKSKHWPFWPLTSVRSGFREADGQLPGWEFVGLARAVLRAAKENDVRVVKFLDATVKFLHMRFYKHAALRPEHVHQLRARALSTMSPAMMLSAPVFKLDRKKFVMTATTLAAHKAGSEGWGDRVEPGLSIARLDVVGDKHDQFAWSQCLAAFSLHAVARYFERSGKRELGDLMEAMRACANLEPPPGPIPSEQVRTEVPTRGGVWSGYWAMVRFDDDADRVPIFAVRTFFSNDDRPVGDGDDEGE